MTEASEEQGARAAKMFGKNSHVRLPIPRGVRWHGAHSNKREVQLKNVVDELKDVNRSN